MITTLAYTLPDSNEWLLRIALWLLIALVIAGGVGLYRISKGEYTLHHDTKDVFIALPIALVHWGSLALLIRISQQDTDLLRYMKSEAAQLATLWLGTYAIAIVQARNCNRNAGLKALLLLGATRLLAGLLAQICTLLIPIVCVIAFATRMFWGYNYLSLNDEIEFRLFLASLPVRLFEAFWHTIRLTGRGEISTHTGWVYGAANVLFLICCCWGWHTICHQYRHATEAELMRAVEKSKPATVRRIIAFNPQLDREASITTAVDKGHRATLRAIIRTPYDLATAKLHAKENKNEKILDYLSK